ncbi:HK97 gp10 family phage protein [Vulgatibacter sp.]|uniref:HK97 gp10 family phage protein n=1 Tax=Vulgatibacter sp. TaxID=1971226 RepID=UPI0035632AC5
MSEGPIRGAKELSKTLKELGPKIEKRVMRQAVTAGAKVFRDEVRKHAASVPMKAEAKRRLRRAIRHKRSRGKPGEVGAGLFVASIPKKGKGEDEKGRPVDDPRVWSVWFDKGTKPRFRGGRSKAKKALAKLMGKKGFSGQIQAHEYFSKGFESGAAKAIEAVADDAHKRVEKEASKP